MKAADSSAKTTGVTPPWPLVPAALFLLILPTNHTMALRMIFLFTALGFALWSARRQGMPPVPIKWALIAWITLAFASVTWSEDRTFSLAEVKTEIGYGMAAFLTFFILTRDRRQLELWLGIVALSLALTCTLSLFGYWRIYPVYYDWDIVHGYASYATYLATAAPLLVLWLTMTEKRWRIAGWVLAALYLGVAYLVASRMFWISFAGVLAVFALRFALRAPRGASRGATLAPALAGIVLAAVLFVLTANQKPVDYTVTTRSDSVSEHVVGTFTQNERRYMWAYWGARIAERPFTGVGFGRDLPHWAHEKPTEWPDLYFAHAHNLILDYGLQMGIPGMLVLIWLFGAITWQFWRFCREPGEVRQLVGVAGLALVVAVFSKNMTDDLFWRTDALVFWSFAGMLLGYGARRPEEVSTRSG